MALLTCVQLNTLNKCLQDPGLKNFHSKAAFVLGISECLFLNMKAKVYSLCLILIFYSSPVDPFCVTGFIDWISKVSILFQVSDCLNRFCPE